MACTWASKVNGILTVVAIGVAVLVDLWDLLDKKKGYSMVHDFHSFSLTNFLTPYSEFLLESLLGASCRLYCAASLPLSLLLCGPSRYPEQHRPW